MTRKKSHYLLVKVTFDRKISRGDAIKQARENLKGEETKCFYRNRKWPHNDIEGTVKVSAVSSVFV